jgi:hypothetical protein
MRQLTDINYVKALQSDLRATLDTPHGKRVMEFLEETCGFYTSVFDPINRDVTLVNEGRRQVVATLKTLLRLTPEQIIALANQGGANGQS